MLGRKLALVIGVIMIFIGILLLSEEFPISIINLLLIAVGINLMLLYVYSDSKFLLAFLSILLSLLVIITAAAIAADFGAAGHLSTLNILRLYGS